MVKEKYCLVALLVLGALPAHGITVFASESALQATPGLTFTSVNFGPLEFLDPSAFYTLDGVTFAGVGIQLRDASPAGGGWPAGRILQGASNGGAITITLPAGAIAFGGMFGELGSTILSVTLSGSGDAAFSYNFTPVNGTSPVYYGFTSTTPFTSITFASDFSFERIALNGFSFGIASEAETPEPAPMALMGGALMALGVLGRWRRKA
ncbi:MAG: hypothetical protein ABI811_08490 [Acidobacteriota bacterium]